MSTLLLILANVSLSVGGQLLLKTGMNKVGSFQIEALGSFIRQTISSPFVLSGLFMYGLGMVTWLILLSRVDLSFAYPMLSLGYILILLVSFIFLGEQITPLRIFGVVLIALGVSAIFKS